MKKILLIVFLFLGLLNINGQELNSINYPSNSVMDYSESQWGFSGKDHKFTMNYTMFGKNVANGFFYGSLGYVGGMWLSGNKTGWGIIGSILAVNIPLLLDNEYDKEEIWVGRNLGAITGALGFTFTIEMYRKDKFVINIVPWLRKR